MSLNEAEFKYCVSYSILRRIKQLNENQIKSISTRKNNWIYGSKREEVVKLINKYLQEHSHTTNSKEITADVNQALQSKFSVNFIRKINFH